MPGEWSGGTGGVPDKMAYAPLRQVLKKLGGIFFGGYSWFEFGSALPLDPLLYLYLYLYGITIGLRAITGDYYFS